MILIGVILLYMFYISPEQHKFNLGCYQYNIKTLTKDIEHNFKNKSNMQYLYIYLTSHYFYVRILFLLVLYSNCVVIYEFIAWPICHCTIKSLCIIIKVHDLRSIYFSFIHSFIHSFIQFNL